MKHVAVWFSCGAASAVAAKKTLELYPDAHVSILNNPIKEEDSDNRRFLRDVETWLDHPIQEVVNPDYPDASCVDVWADRNFMSGPTGAPCTMLLKKKARQVWENENNPDFTVLGFTSEETGRAERFKLTERDTLLTPLIDLGITKQDCFDILLGAGIDLPSIYKRGFPNANCVGCVKATSPTYWNLVREEYPEVFEERAAQSRQIGAKLTRVKGQRIFLDELDPTAKGQSLKNFHVECGLFCEERD